MLLEVISMPIKPVPEQGMSEKYDSKLELAFAQYFYQGDNLHAKIQSYKCQSIYRFEHGVLAQREIHDGRYEIGLLYHDEKLSVSRVPKYGAKFGVAYAPYGCASLENLKDALLGFSGERFDEVAVRYLLGNGYRAYSPSLMRFTSPDNLSPFGRGGVNSYVYCIGDPVNFTDPTGHGRIFNFFRSLLWSSKSPGGKQADQDVRIGYHGTSKAAAKKILKEGFKSPTGTLFVTDTYENALNYAGLKKKGAVLAVSTVDFAVVKKESSRGVVRSKGINELRIPGAAHHVLTFKRVSSPGEPTDFSRFITLEEQMARDIKALRQRMGDI
jgi:RHS repeat-associated protein